MKPFIVGPETIKVVNINIAGPVIIIQFWVIRAYYVMHPKPEIHVDSGSIIGV